MEEKVAFPEIPGYQLWWILGKGAHSTIYWATDEKSGDRFAIKHVVREGPRDDKFVDQAENEAKVCQAVDHPVIRKCRKFKKRSKLFQMTDLYLVLELVHGVSLREKPPKSNRTLMKVAVEVCKGLSALHAAGYVHADIKPDNILVHRDGAVKIIDLGQSCPMGTNKDRIQGSLEFIAPEQLAKGKLTGLTDVFNLGATLYWCLTKKPVPSFLREQPGQRVGENELVSPHELNPLVPERFSELVMDCIEEEPGKRPAMSSVLSRLELALELREKEHELAAVLRERAKAAELQSD